MCLKNKKLINGERRKEERLSRRQTEKRHTEKGGTTKETQRVRYSKEKRHLKLNVVTSTSPIGVEVPLRRSLSSSLYGFLLFRSLVILVFCLPRFLLLFCNLSSHRWEREEKTFRQWKILTNVKFHLNPLVYLLILFLIKFNFLTKVSPPQNYSSNSTGPQ